MASYNVSCWKNSWNPINHHLTLLLALNSCVVALHHCAPRHSNLGILNKQINKFSNYNIKETCWNSLGISLAWYMVPFCTDTAKDQAYGGPIIGLCSQPIYALPLKALFKSNAKPGLLNSWLQNSYVPCTVSLLSNVQYKIRYHSHPSFHAVGNWHKLNWLLLQNSQILASKLLNSNYWLPLSCTNYVMLAYYNRWLLQTFWLLPFNFSSSIKTYLLFKQSHYIK